MAVVTISSNQITNKANKVLSNSNVTKGLLVEAVATLETTASNDANSKYQLLSLPSNARVSQVLLYCDAFGGSSAANLGLYRSDTGEAVDVDFFASALSLVSAINGTDVTHESGDFNIDDVEKPLWMALGLTEDPKIFYDVVATVSTATTNAATLSLKVRYVE